MNRRESVIATLDSAAEHAERRGSPAIALEMDRVAEQLLLGDGEASAGSVNMKYIMSNIKLLSDHDLWRLERDIKIADLKKRLEHLGVWVSDSGEVSNTKLRLNLDEPVEKLVKKVEEEVGTKFGDIDWKAYNSLNTVITYHYLRHKKGNSYTISNQGYHLNALLAFLKWVMTGKIDPDYRKIHELMDEKGWKGLDSTFSPGKGAYEIEFMGAKIKKFKNGRLDVKFSSPKHAQKMQETVEQWWDAKKRH